MEKELVQFLLDHYGVEKMRPKDLSIFKEISKPFRQRIKSKIITIGGTNGKGETSYWVSRILSREGSTGLWISPHVVSICERMSFNNEMIGIEEFGREVSELHQMGLKVSYFEFLFLVFLNWVAKKNPDFLVLEVGLGGRLDAVNVFDADICAITSIGLDHQEILGNTEELILREKIQIVRKGKILVSGILQEGLKKEVRTFCRDNGVKLVQIEGGGSFHQRNKWVAERIGGELGCTSNGVDWEKPAPFRGERKIFQGIELILTGSHNMQGIEEVSRVYYAARVHVGFSKRPEMKQMLDYLIQRYGNDAIYFYYFEHFKAPSREEVKELVEMFSLPVFELTDFKLNCQGGGPQLITGSYYFLGAVYSSFLFP